MRQYKLTYLIPANLDESDIKKLQERINSYIEKEEGILTKSFKLLKKRLGYPIKEMREAYLAVLDFTLDPQKIEHLKKELDKEKDILRYLISSRPKPLLQKKTIQQREMKLEKETPKETPPGPEKAAPKKEKKVELKEIDKKLEEILGE